MKYLNRALTLLAAGALLVSMAGCSSTGSSAGSTAASAASLAAAETEFSLADATLFTFTDGGISAAGDDDGYTIQGTTLTITAPGTYGVSGSCADGNILIEGGTQDVVLVLNGLDLTSTTTAPILCGKSAGVTIGVQSGTQNSLADTAANNKDSDTASADAESAVVKCKDGAQVVLCGGGTLNITAAGKNGIKSGTENEGRAAPRRKSPQETPPAPRRKDLTETTPSPRLKQQPVKFLSSEAERSDPLRGGRSVLWSEWSWAVGTGGKTPPYMSHTA